MSVNPSNQTPETHHKYYTISGENIPVIDEDKATREKHEDAITTLNKIKELLNKQLNNSLSTENLDLLKLKTISTEIHDGYTTKVSKLNGVRLFFFRLFSNKEEEVNRAWERITSLVKRIEKKREESESMLQSAQKLGYEGKNYAEAEKYLIDRRAKEIVERAKEFGYEGTGTAKYYLAALFSSVREACNNNCIPVKYRVYQDQEFDEGKTLRNLLQNCTPEEADKFVDYPELMEVYLITLLKKEADFDADTIVGGKPILHWAVKGGHFEIAKELITRGASIDKKDTNGKTALYYVCWVESYTKERIAFAEFLLDKGADATTLPILHGPARGGNVRMVLLLLKHHADVNAVNDKGMTPLGMVYYITNLRGDVREDVFRRHDLEYNNYRLCEVANLLLDKGANPNIDVIVGESVLHWAKVYGHDDIVSKIEKKPLKSDTR